MFLPFQGTEFWAYFNSNGSGSHQIFSGIHALFEVPKLQDPCNWQALQDFLDTHKDRHVVFALSYDLKNDIEALATELPDYQGFPKVIAVCPERVGSVDPSTHIITWQDNKSAQTDALLGTNPEAFIAKTPLTIQPRLSRDAYLERTSELLRAIHRGDLYEINFCTDFFAEQAQLNPWELYQDLNRATEAPYSVCMQFREHWVLSGSPELYLHKQGCTLSSAPIKGTVKRSQQPGQDLELAKMLRDSAKERAENVMIVDLVRNDLSKVATRGSVRVEELCSIKSFKTVHHMVSTIAATLKPKTSFTDIIHASFPMGSMTGAPKISAMQHSDLLEPSARGIYSGTLGYIKPNQDFACNVVIRSIIYNTAKNYLSFKTGSALTAQCQPELEYEECLVKAEALLQSLHGTLVTDV